MVGDALFQSFETTSAPEQGAPRLAALREALAAAGLDGYLVPRSDAHQGEYVAPCDERLEWLTGFGGSAGFAIILPQIAGVFIDGRYRVQVKAQVDLRVYTPVHWPETTAGDWLAAHLPQGVVGFDPWLHTSEEIAKLETVLAGRNITLKPVANMIDPLWHDRPSRPAEPAFLQPEALAGQSSLAKRARLGQELRSHGQAAAVLTLPDSICWLLNIRGADVPKNPVVQAFAILHADGRVAVFADPQKFSPELRSALGVDIAIHPSDAFPAALHALSGVARLDQTSAPIAVAQILAKAEVGFAYGDDPCRLPKACKTPAEIAATREAHLRDGAAVTEFLCWLDRQEPGAFSEIDVVKALEGYRRATGVLHDISFDTISGAGPNGAIIHYRVSHESNRVVGLSELLLVDSGAQYQDGTTDITRTIAIGTPSEEACDCYTRVLRGLIAISQVRFPKGLAGRDLDALARYPLWLAGYDYDHGTGHGVGAFLSVHEGPQRLSRASEIPLQPGMILSNEPGYYREGAFGIRLENLIVVHEAADLGDKRAQYAFETLTYAPFDRRLIQPAALSQEELGWLNRYHATVLEKIADRLSPEARQWAEAACAPMTLE